jgi:hypothetical protein
MSGMLAKVINSSVGTSDFKSLDEVLLSKIRLIGSDDVFFSYDGEWVTENSDYTYRTSSYITFDTDGAVKFKTYFSDYSTNGVDKTTTMTIAVEDVTGTTIEASSTAIYLDDNAAATSDYELSVAVNVTKGSKYKVRLSSSNTSSYKRPSGKLTVCATPVFTTSKCTLTT